MIKLEVGKNYDLEFNGNRINSRLIEMKEASYGYEYLKFENGMPLKGVTVNNKEEV